jgi:putative Mn2+ efflux pump MntP
MAYPWFSSIALALVAVLALLAVGASVAVWRIRSLAAAYRFGLIGAIAVVASAAIGWIIFVSPVYVD